MMIRAAVARGPQAPFVMETLTLADPAPGEVLVRIVGVGLCHTDLVARDQFIPIPLPAVLGHEGSGIVERIGEGVTKVAPGDPVVLSFNSCGHCARCEESLPSYCQNFPALNYSGARAAGPGLRDADGQIVSGDFFGQSSFASYALAYERNVVKVTSAAPLELLGPLGCGFQTGAGAIMRSMACPAGSSLAIFGGGAVGMAAVLGAVVQGCAPIIVAEPMQVRRELALTLGATHAFDPTAGGAPDAIRAIAPQGVDFVLETSGREEAVEAGLASLSSHGVLGLVGVPPRIESSLSVNLASLITFGHRIQGIIEGDSDLDGFIPELIALHAAGRFPLEKLVEIYPMSEINQAIAAQAKGEFIKAILIP